MHWYLNNRMYENKQKLNHFLKLSYCFTLSLKPRKKVEPESCMTMTSNVHHSFAPFALSSAIKTADSSGISHSSGLPI